MSRLSYGSKTVCDSVAPVLRHEWETIAGPWFEKPTHYTYCILVVFDFQGWGNKGSLKTLAQKHRRIVKTVKGDQGQVVRCDLRSKTIFINIDMLSLNVNQEAD